MRESAPSRTPARLLFRAAVAVFSAAGVAAVVAPSPAAALNEVVNWSFETGTAAAGVQPSSWVWGGSFDGATETFQVASQNNPAGATAPARDGSRYFYAEWTTNNSPPKTVGRTLTSSAYTAPHAANARVTFWYWRTFPSGTTATTALTVSVRTSPGGVLVGSAVVVPATSSADAGWTQGTVNVALPANTAVAVQVAIDVTVPRTTIARVFLDDVRMQVSPHGLAYGNTTPAQVDLSWDDSVAQAGAGPALASTPDRYHVHRDGAFAGDAATPYSAQSGLSPNTTYVFTVADKDAGGTESPESPSVTVVTRTNAPGKPAVTATNTVTVTWDPPIGGASSYHVYRSVNGGAFSPTPYASSVGSPPWNDPSVSPDTTYAYKVSSVNSAGVEGYVSAESDPKTTWGPSPNPPTNVTATVVDWYRVDVAWNAPVGGTPPTGYSVYRSGTAGPIATLGAAARSHSDTSAQGGTTYTYSVTAIGNGSESTPTSATAVLTPPGPVLNLRASSTAWNAVQLAWDPASGAAEYRVERNPDAGGAAQWGLIATRTTAAYTDTAVAANRTYQYRVRAYTSGKFGGYSNTLDVSTPSQPPAIVTNLVKGTVLARSVALSWDAAARASNYRVERTSVAGGGSGWTEIRIEPGTSYTDASALPSTTYYYRVRAWNDGGFSSDYSNVVMAETPGIRPDPVTDLRTTNVQATQIDLQWEAAVGATRYHVERYPNSADLAQWGEIGTGVATTWSDATVLSQREYQYRVRAWNVIGYGDPSNIAYATTPASVGPGVVPGKLTAKADACNKVTLRAAYTGDADRDATVSFARATSLAGPFSAIASCQNLAGAVSPRSCSQLGGVTSGQTYVYRATFSDPDNAPQPDPVYSGSLVIPACGAVVTLSDPGTQPASAQVEAGSVARLVLKVRLGATNGTVDVSGLKVANVAGSPRAEAGRDVLSLQLWRDQGLPGVFEPAADGLLATSQWDAATGKYAFRISQLQIPSDTSALLFVTMNVAPGAHVGAMLDASVASDDITVSTAGASVALGAVVAPTGAVFTIREGPIAGSSDPLAPMATIVNPGAGAAVSGTFPVQVQAFDPAGLGSVQVALTTDGWTATPITLARNTRWVVGAKAAIYEGSVAGLAPGAYRLQARVTNLQTTKQVLSIPIVVTVNAARAGDGRLLRRDNAPQLCTACHATHSHSSQSVADSSTGQSKYGSWSTTCRDCHTPHGTSNVYLVNKEVTPPPVGATYQPSKKVYFADKSKGYSTAEPSVDPGQIGSAAFANRDFTGICQVCHTRTVDRNNQPLFQNAGGNDATHGGGNACTECHQHTGGFRPNCTGCHGTPGRQAFSDVAPPLDTCGNVAPQPGSVVNRVGAHQAHLAGDEFTDGIECGQCHVNPPIRGGHPSRNACSSLESERAVLAWGPLATGAAATWTGTMPPPSPYQHATQTCASTYCHGNFRNSGVTGTVAWNAALACGGCHGTPPTTGHTTTQDCSMCHGDGYELPSGGGIGAAARATHVDGILQLRQNVNCTSCHGNPDRTPAPYVETASDRFRSAPPRDLAGNTVTTARGVGAHESHVYQPTLVRPFTCARCHPTPTDNWHTDGEVDLVFDALASFNGPGVGWSGTAPFTCSATWCHGDNFGPNTRGAAPIPEWTVVGSSFTGCGDCHKSPPTDADHVSLAHPSNAMECHRCHDQTVKPDGTIERDLYNLHVNNVVEVSGATCTSCHGDAISIAPPPVADPANLNGEGAHRAHVIAAMALRPGKLECTECHPDRAFDFRHADGTVDMRWDASLSPSTAWNDGTSRCSAAYCHGGEDRQAAWGGSGRNPLWTSQDDTYRTCGACHASPPPLNAATHHPQNPSCDLCHPAGATTTTITGAARDAHIDGGDIDVVRSGCTLCHGDLSMTGIGPTDPSVMPGWTAATRDTTGATSGPAFGAHLTHLTASTLTPNNARTGGLAALCGDCHQVPADGDRAHATGSGSGGARASVPFGAWVRTTRAPVGGWPTNYTGSNTATANTQAGRCASTYCHGAKFVGNAAFETTNMEPSWTEGSSGATCGTACHKIYPTSNGHRTMTPSTNCIDCHAGYDCRQESLATCTVDPGDPGVGRAPSHINGAQDVSVPLTCASCHGTEAGRTAYSGVLGTPDSRLAAMPPDDVSAVEASNRGGNDLSNQVGAHQGHVNPNPSQLEGQIFLPIPCKECHTGAAESFPMQHQDGTALVDYTGSTWSNLNNFTSVFTASDRTDTGTPATCTSYCHFSAYPVGRGSVATWEWKTSLTAACSSCHGLPPRDGDHASVPNAVSPLPCLDCHAETVNAQGKILFTNPLGTWTTKHINGTRNFDNDLTCESCHGNAARAEDLTADPLHRAAPPKAANGGGSSLPTDRYVGTHEAHVYAQSRRSSKPVPCIECHYADTPLIDQDDHANGASPITGNFGPLARKGNLSPTYDTNPASPTYLACSATYCHGNFKGGSGNGASQKWNDPRVLGCTACHGMPPMANGTTSHKATDTACEGCHEGYTYTSVDPDKKAQHVDGIVQSNATCKGCHQSRTGESPTQRVAVVNGANGAEGDDFIRPSRHVSDGTSGTAASQIVKDVDCILCHAEGNAITSTDLKPKTDSVLHGGVNKTLDLRNLDAPAKCFTDPPDPSCYWCPPKTSCAPPPGSVIAGWQWPGARNFTDPWYVATASDRDNMDSFCMSCHDANGASGIAVKADGLTLEVSNDPTDPLQMVPRRARPFNPADNLRNGNEFATSNTHTLLKNWRIASYTSVLNVRDQYNSTNQPRAGWASHHNLNQFTKRYDSVDSTGYPSTLWTPGKTTVDGLPLNETAGLHCSDCHLNETNAHGSRKTWYLLRNTNNADKEGDVAFTGMTSTTSTDVCARCHNPAVYAIGASSAPSRTKGHGDARCDRWGGVAATASGVAGLGWTGTGIGQLNCLACHGGETPGGIHGTNTTYLPGNAAPAVKKYRFMGGGGSMRFYSPKGATNVTDADWQLGTGTVGCYTIGTADAFGNCVNHKGGFGSNGINRSRQLSY